MTKSILIGVALILSVSVQAQHWRWVNYLQGGGANHAVFDVHVPEGDNYAYAVGRYRATATFYGQDTNVVNPYQAGDRDVYIAKIDSNGNYVWIVTEGGAFSDYPNAVCTDEMGNVYIAGTFEQTAYFDTTPIVGDVAGDVFVAKYNSDGVFQWVITMNGAGWEWAQEIECDLNGNIYVGGYQTGNFNYGTGTLVDKGYFVSKIDYNGNVIWCKGPTNNQAASDSWVFGMKYEDGRLFFSGSVKNSVNFDSFTLPAYSWQDGYIAEMDLDGNILNAFRFGGIYYDVCNDIELHGDTIYAVGSYANYVNFDTVAMYAPVVGAGGADAYNSRDAFLAKFLTNGTCLWVKDIKGDYIDESHSVLVNQKGNIVLTGSYGQIDINSSCCAYGEIYVREYDPNGNINWTLQPDGAGHLGEGMAIEEDASGNYFFGGKIKGNHYFQDILITTPTIINHTAIMSRIYPPLQLSQDSLINVCFGDTLWVYTSDPFGSPQVFDWVTSTANILFQSNDSLQLVADGADSIYFTVSNSFKNVVYAKDTMVYYFNYLQNPYSTLNSLIDTCADFVELNAGAFAEYYNWGTGFIQYDSLFQVSADGIYHVELIGTNGCKSVDSVEVTLHSAQPISLGTDTTTCENQFVLNAGSSGELYDWGSGFLPYDSLFVVTIDGTYSVVVQDSNGCVTTDEINVTLLDCSGIIESEGGFIVWFDYLNRSIKFSQTCENCKIVVYDLTGRAILDQIPNSTETFLPISINGVYYVGIFDQEGRELKVIKILIL